MKYMHIIGMPTKAEIFFEAIVDQNVALVEDMLSRHSINVNKPLKTRHISILPLSLAARDADETKQEASLRIFDLLLEAGADVNGIDKGSSGPLYHAVAKSPPLGFELARRLLQAGADPNIQPDKLIQTPLLKALNVVSTESIGVVLLLLAYGADPTITGGISHESPIMLAEQLESSDLIDALKMPVEHYDRFKSIILRAVRNRNLTEDQALLLQEIFNAHFRRWHAVAAFAAAENAKSRPTGKGTSRRSKTKKSSAAAAGAGASRRNSRRAQH